MSNSVDSTCTRVTQCKLVECQADPICADCQRAAPQVPPTWNRRGVPGNYVARRYNPTSGQFEDLKSDEYDRLERELQSFLVYFPEKSYDQLQALAGFYAQPQFNLRALQAIALDEAVDLATSKDQKRAALYGLRDVLRMIHFDNFVANVDKMILQLGVSAD